MFIENIIISVTNIFFYHSVSFLINCTLLIHTPDLRSWPHLNAFIGRSEDLYSSVADFELQTRGHQVDLRRLVSASSWPVVFRQSIHLLPSPSRSSRQRARHFVLPVKVCSTTLHCSLRDECMRETFIKKGRCEMKCTMLCTLHHTEIHPYLFLLRLFFLFPFLSRLLNEQRKVNEGSLQAKTFHMCSI